jgi:radical SAM superfamily enzyme YgiQ (UPF0313 family)
MGPGDVSGMTTQKKRIYLINPRTPENFWSMRGAVKIVGEDRTFMPNAALLTLAALTPPDVEVEYIYCDENLTPVKLDLCCDLVALTGYTLQADRIQELGREFRSRGVPVALGGVFATLESERARTMADHLFVGEGEEIWPRFLREWIAGSAASLYRQEGFVDMNRSPAPDLSYIRGKDYMCFAVQTCRGCPHSCDYCDVVRLVGRKFRHKTVAQVMQEVKNSHARGAETVFFSDDNFFVDRKFTFELLREVIAWNRTLPRPLSFSTQATVAIGSDDELLQLLAEARFSVVFLGVETLRKDCLDEVNKGQMSRFDVREIVPKISSYGIVPYLGMIVGFDHDTPQVFEDIEQFLEDTASPMASISILNAPKDTVLYQRMRSEGRLSEEFLGYWHMTTNIVPKGMTREELYTGHRALFQRLYEPANFQRRILKWLRGVKYFASYSTRKKTLFRFFMILRILRHFLFRVPGPVRRMFFSVAKSAWQINPRLVSRAISVMVQYWHYYEFSRREAWLKVASGPPPAIKAAPARDAG